MTDAHPLAALAASAVQRATPAQFWLGFCAGVVMALWLLYFGFSRLKRSRLITDMPTSKVRSAAQGYVELEGHARLMPGEPIHATLSGLPCVWFRYQVEHRDRDARGRSDEWRVIESGTSDAIFHLRDDTGQCIVDPDGADITPSTCVRWRGHAPRPGAPPRDTGFLARLLDSGPYRYTEYRINEYDSLYIIGDFSGLGDSAAVSLREATGDLLSAWKKDRPELLRRFDANGDGQIDMEEWETARRAAESAAAASLGAHRQHPEHNLMRRPRYGRPYIISCMPQHVLVRRYRRMALLSALGFLAMLALLAWTANLRAYPPLKAPRAPGWVLHSG